MNDNIKKQILHDINTFVQKYTKDTVGKGSDIIRSYIYEDMFIIRGEGFLTDAEKYLSETPSGCETVRSSRIEGILRFKNTFNEYLEEKFNGVKAIHNIFDIKPMEDFWLHMVVFNKKIV